MLGSKCVREEKRVGKVEWEDYRGNGWEGLVVVVVAVAWSLGLIDHGGLEREREFETRETEFERIEERDFETREKVIGGI